jgi:hypothetical protein
MKLSTFLIPVVVALLFFGCATTGEVNEAVTKEEVIDKTVEPSSEEVQKEPVKIITTVYYPISEESYFGDGTKDEYRVFSYDDSGSLLLKEELFSAEDLVQESAVYDYPDAGTVKKSVYNSEMVKISYEINILDINGQVIKQEKYDNKDILQSVSEYAYEGGKKITWMIFNESNSLLSTTNYIYSEDLLTRIESFSPGGELEEHFILNYDNTGLLLENIHYDFDGKIENSRSYEYMEGYLVLEKVNRKNGSVLRKIMYKNDAFGNPVETVFMDAGDNVQERIVQMYGRRENISYEK